MRRRDKLKNIERANLLAEQRHLESKGVLSEALTTDLEQFAEQTLKPKLEGAGFQVALFGADKLKMVVDKVDENPKLIGIIWNPSHLKPYGSKNHISIHMNGEATAKVNSILSKFSFAKESGEAKQGEGWDSDTSHKALATYNEGDLVLIDGNNVRTKVIFQAGNPEKLGLREAVAYKNASDNELAQYIVNLSNELTAAKSHGDEKEIGYIMKDLAEVKAELESRKKAKTNEKLELGENISGIGDISVEIKHDNGETVVKGRVEPTDIGFVIYNENQDGRPFNIVWKEKLNKFVSGESMWYDEQDVVATSGYEDAFNKLEASYGKTDLKEGQMYDGIEWESVGSGRDDMGYEHVIGTDNEGKFYEASAIINMRDEIESINDIEEMSEDDYNKLA